MPNTFHLKVCGLRDNIEEVQILSPEYLGFIFYPKSPRYVGDDFEMPEGLTAKKVGVFVNDSVENVKRLFKKHQLDLVQLHGDEDVEYCKRLKGIPLIKVFAGNNLPEQEILDAFADYIEYYLFDTKTDKHGGTGISFDWESLNSIKLKRPFFLSGGINLNNASTISKMKNMPEVIDVNSQFESSPGNKNISLLRELIDQL